MIHVAILEDAKEVALSLQELFNKSEEFSCHKVYHNAEDAMTFLPSTPVDVLIVDIGLPRATGIEAMAFLHAKCPDMQFCVFTVHEDDDKIFESLKVGAKGYILKGDSSLKMLEAIKELKLGGSPMSSSIARRVLDVYQLNQWSPASKKLPISAREYEILRLLSEGFYYKEIAEKLFITTGTVKQHIHKIYEKLEVSNRTEAINKMKNL